VVLECNVNSLKCAVLNGICEENPCLNVVGDECAWGCKRSKEGTCVSDLCASHDVRDGKISSCLNDVNNKCIYSNNRCTVNPCSLHEEKVNCVKDIENKCIFDGSKCTQGSCELFLNDLNLCSENERCVVISDECHENPCNSNSCKENLCVISTTTGLCSIDGCAVHKATDSECGSYDGCVLKIDGLNEYCISGICNNLKEKMSCEANEKCLFSENVCISNVCKGINQKDCEDNMYCSFDNNKCVFDTCSEGSKKDDEGILCSSKIGCGYESYDDTCKVANSKFTTINIGSASGIV
jgi:hypothetical protein